jgi:hypothetical protein
MLIEVIKIYFIFITYGYYSNSFNLYNNGSNVFEQFEKTTFKLVTYLAIPDSVVIIFNKRLKFLIRLMYVFFFILVLI